MLTIAPYTNKYHQDLQSYILPSEQAEFSKQPNEWLDEKGNFLGGTDLLPMVILKNQRAIGFFILDSSQNFAEYSNNQPHTLLLRSMSINPKYQKQGLAKKALSDDCLLPIVQQFFPTAQIIVLGVNHRNIAAHALYLKSGFQDTQRTYIGIKGLQHILEKRIKAA